VKPDVAAGQGAPSAGDPYVPHSGNGGYRVRHYDLELAYGPASNRLEGTAVIDATATQRLSRFSLDLERMHIGRVTVDGRRPTRFAVRAGKLLITLGSALAAGSTFQIRVTYTGNPRPLTGPWGEIGWEELTDGVIVASQPNGAPSWFPCNDHPSNKATYRIGLTVDSGYRVVANGDLVEHRVRAGATHWVYEQRQPMATYLATVQIGRYELLDLPAAAVRQQALAPGRLSASVAEQFARQDEMMACFIDRFGPYPYDDYTVVVTDDELEIPLEAQGMSIFGANHLDGEYERLIAHELAHQWFGNCLTVGAWRHIWLHEGFACYAEWIWSEASGGASADQLAERHWHRLADKPQDLILDDPEPDLMFDDRVYKRGALTLHALRRVIRDEAFFDLLRSWVAAHRHGVVSTDLFLAHVSSAAGADAAAELTSWLSEPKLPRLPDRHARG
jgi:aminopeptidase N